jgi:succinyl-CoA synthetase beta subunit
MNLHEYQAKELFREYGIPVPIGTVAHSIDGVVEEAKKLDCNRCVLKAQVHAGGRGKGGGVVVSDDVEVMKEAAGRLLGSYLVTPQTDKQGLPVHSLLVETTLDIARELYLGVLVDRSTRRVVFMVSSAGGMDIEAVASQTPEKILTVAADPVAGLQPYQCRQIAYALGLEGKQPRALTAIMSALFAMITEKDASLIEINPLIVTNDGQLVALDAKINLDDNALYRHPDLAQLRDASQENDKEYQASQFDLNYISLDGDIGCMVNGAGLAMATMDLIKLHGGEPANFLDVGGGTTADRVAEAFKLIVSESRVKAILVNIFGGIVRCDLIAEGVIEAVKEVGVDIPVVVRLEGTNVQAGRDMLLNSGLSIISAETLDEGARMVVSASTGENL